MTTPTPDDDDIAEWLLRLAAFANEVRGVPVPLTVAVTIDAPYLKGPVLLARFANEAAEKAEAERQAAET